MNRSVNRLILSPVVLLLACSQSDPAPPTGPRAAPSATARMYVLRSVAGDPVPAVLIDNEYVTIVALADTIWLEADGSGIEVATERATDKASGTPPVVSSDERPFSYDLAGGRIEVSLECIDVIIRSCVAPPHYQGGLTEARLTLDRALHYRTPLSYDRVPSSSTSIPPTSPATKL
jgi:hypothetical protein